MEIFNKDEINYIESLYKFCYIKCRTNDIPNNKKCIAEIIENIFDNNEHRNNLLKFFRTKDLIISLITFLCYKALYEINK